MAGRGSVWSYCTCLDPATGRRYPQGKCPASAQRGHVKWAFVIDLPRKGGRRAQLKRMGYSKKEAAVRALEAQLPSIHEGTAPSLADRQATLGAFLDAWLRVARNQKGEPWRPSTVVTYRGCAEGYLKPQLGHIRLIALSPDNISAMTADLQRRGLSRRTVHQTYATLRTALNAAMRARKITWNPCAAAPVAGPGTPQPAAWTVEQTKRFLARAYEREPGLAVAFQVSAMTGLRRGELAGLQWRDIDLNAGLLRVERAVADVGGPCTSDCAPECPGGLPHVGKPKTPRSRRTVAVNPMTVAALREHKRRQAVRSLGGWVFPGPDGAVLRPFVLSHRFADLAAGLGLPKSHLHALRHGYATHAIEAGEPVHVVSEAMGHHKPEFTMNVYAAVLPHQRAAVADSIERLYGDSVTSL
jgi:integrase